MKEHKYDYTYFPDFVSGISSEEDCERHISEYCAHNKSFHLYLNEKIVEKKISVPELMRRSCINKNYGYNILNGARRKPSRDRIIALCIAARMTLGELQHALILAKQAVLCWCDERDVRIASAVENSMGDVMKVNLILAEKGVEPLDV